MLAARERVYDHLLAVCHAMPPVVPLSSNAASFIEQTTKPRISSPLAWPMALGTSSVQVVAANPARTALLLTNTSTIDNVYICPAIDGNGNPLAAGGAGSLLLTPGQWIFLGSDSRSSAAWNAAAASGSNVPFAAWEFLG